MHTQPHRLDKGKIQHNICLIMRDANSVLGKSLVQETARKQSEETQHLEETDMADVTFVGEAS